VNKNLELRKLIRQLKEAAINEELWIIKKKIKKKTTASTMASNTSQLVV